MIRTALKFLATELDSYIVAKEQDPGNYPAGQVVDLTSIVLPRETIHINDKTHISAMLIGVDEERREGKRPYYIPTDDKQFYVLNPPVEIDLLVLFVAHSADYEMALRDLSYVIGYFQSNPVFDAANYPTLNANVDPDRRPWQLIDRLSLSLLSMTFEQQSNLWAMLGSNFIPSVAYRVRTLSVFETQSKQKVASIHQLGLRES